MDSSKDKYLFTSSRLGFRTWYNDDIRQMALLNKDPEVMEFFPFLPSKKETEDFIQRMNLQYSENNFCYFAVDHLETGKFIGFIGLSLQNFDTDFTPCIDIGWRINKEYWGNGLATEGALECITYAKNQLGLHQIYSMASKINSKSIKVMKKIGMNYIKDFEHPRLLNHPSLEICVLYGIDLA